MRLRRLLVRAGGDVGGVLVLGVRDRGRGGRVRVFLGGVADAAAAAAAVGVAVGGVDGRVGRCGEFLGVLGAVAGRGLHGVRCCCLWRRGGGGLGRCGCG